MFSKIHKILSEKMIDPTGRDKTIKRIELVKAFMAWLKAGKIPPKIDPTGRDKTIKRIELIKAFSAWLKARKRK